MLTSPRDVMGRVVREIGNCRRRDNYFQEEIVSVDIIITLRNM